jgi:hypothetical protein
MAEDRDTQAHKAPVRIALSGGDHPPGDWGSQIQGRIMDVKLPNWRP